MPLETILGRLTALDDDEMARFMENMYGPWHRVTGIYRDFSTLRDRLRSAVLFFVQTVGIIFYTYIQTITIAEAGTDRSDLCLQGIIYLAPSLLAYVVILSLNIMRKTLCKAHTYLLKGFFKYDLEIRGELTAKLYYWQSAFNKYSFPACVLGICFGVFGPQFLRASSQERFYKGIDMWLIIPIYYPIRIQPTLDYVIINLHIVTHSLMVAATIALLANLVLNLHMIWICEMRRLIDSVKGAEARALEMFRKTWGPGSLLPEDKYLLYRHEGYLACYLACLKENVDHHITINRFLKTVQSVMQLSQIMGMATTSVIMACCLSVHMEPGSYVDMGAKLTGVTIFSICIMLASVLCIFGQQMVDLPEELRQAVYSSDWIYCDARVTSRIKILMEVLRKPIQPVVLKVATYDMKGLVFILNASFTYYNLLLMSRGMEMDVL